MAKYVKEFENLILLENKEEAQLTIIPGSESDIYLQIINKLKSIKDDYPKELGDLIERFQKVSTFQGNQKILLISLLTEYDLKSTTNERKQEILEKIRDVFFSNINFDYQKPNVHLNSKIESETTTKYESKLDNSITNIDKILNEIYLADKYKILTKFNAINYNYIHLIDFDKISDICFEAIVNHLPYSPLFNTKPGFLKKFIDYINKKSDFDKSNVQVSAYFEHLTLQQIEEILKNIKSPFVDKTMFITEIVNKRFLDDLSTTSDSFEKRDIYFKICEYLDENNQQKSNLKSEILLRILELGIEINDYNLKTFLEYLENPVVINHTNYNHSQEFIEKSTKQTKWTVRNLQIKNANQEAVLIQKYLKHFFLIEKLKTENFIQFFKKSFLDKEYYEALIQTGDDINTEVAIKILGKKNYEDLINKTEITICDHNKKSFGIDEDVSITVDVKNIQTLFIKIFEINTENYYYNKKAAINSAISLEGLIATYEDPYSFNEKPQKKIRRVFKFEKLEKRRGLYIIEFIGNGVSSRALIKKGGLSIVSRSIKYGKMVFILDENSNICKNKTTGLWVKSTFYSANPDNGSIIIPYMKIASKENAIIVNEGFAELATLELTEEVYTLYGNYFFNHEALLLGNNVKVLFRPYLFINNRVTDLHIVKKSKITVLISKIENDQSIPITSVFDNLELTNKKEIEFNFQVPPKIEKISFTFECEVHNNSKDVNDKLNVKSEYIFDTNNEELNFVKTFLRKIDNNYYLNILGKNGEPKAQIMSKIKLNHSIIKDIPVQTLQTDSNGEIFLGELDKVVSLTVTINYLNQDISQKFELKDGPSYTYPDSIDILESDSIKLPISIKDRGSARLISYNHERKLLSDFSNSVNQRSLNDLGTQFEIQVSQLKSGYYLLFLNNSLSPIRINVHKGKIWETSNFIILKNKIIENSIYRYPIHFENIQIEEAKDSEQILKIKVNKNAINPRIHIMAFTFLNSHCWKFYEDIATNLKKQVLLSTHDFQNWDNIYQSNRILHEEIQYVFDRKNAERFMGNSLEKPSLLLKRQFIRDTTTDNQTLAEGTEFEKISANVVKSEQAKLADSYKVQQSIRHSGNTYSMFHNFLSTSPLILYNVPLNSAGETEIKLNLNHYSHLQLIAVDERSVCEDLISLKNTQINKKDLSLKIPLDSQKFYSEIRHTELLKSNSSFLIHDITSTNFKLVDSLEKLIAYKTLVNQSLSSDFNEISELLKINELKEDELKKFINKFFSNEINIFMYFRHPDIFQKYIKPNLKYKMEKTFIDFFLLNDRKSLNTFLNPNKIYKLNPFEKCLLIYVFREENPDLMKSLARKLLEEAEISKPSPQEMKRLFNIIMNLKIDSEKSSELIETSTKTANLMGGLFGSINNFSVGLIGSQPPNYLSIQPDDRRQFHNLNVFNQVQRGMDLTSNVFQNAQFQMNEYKLNENIGSGANVELELEEDCFENYEKNYSQENINTIYMKNNLLKQAGKSKEYSETHNLKRYNNNIKNDLFWADLALFWLDPKKILSKDFLTKYVILQTDNISQLIFLLSVIDLPSNSQNHNFNRKEGQNLEIISASNLLLFTKEIKETPSDLKSTILIAQHLTSRNKKNNEVKEVIKNEIYCHETIVTNISSNKCNFELLIQIPQGSIPVCNSDYSKTYNLSLDKFKTTSVLTYFYFPNEGNFIQFPPSASIDGVVVAKGTEMHYNFLDYSFKKSQNDTFDDVLFSGSKQNIVEYIEAKEDFKIQEFSKIYFLLKDKEFYNSIINILRKRGIYEDVVWKFGFYHKDEITVKEFLESSDNIKRLIGLDCNFKLLQLNKTNNYDLCYHLDYYPIINARVHKLGNDQKSSILNKEFRETYEKFITDLLLKKEINNKDYLRLCYYLILQDRNEEAIKTLEKIDKSKFNVNDNFEIQFDYISAFLDTISGYPDFKIARELCKKYKNFPLTHWAELFEEIDDQLFEYEGKEIFEDIDSLVDEEKKKKLLTKNIVNTEPQLSIQNKGLEFAITYSNISSLSIKFYLIDLEILFSRTPFITQNSNDFSFVQPNYISLHSTNQSTKEEIFNFNVPKEFVDKNFFIEVASNSNKKVFDTYFSNSLNVSIVETLGEIKVSDKNNKRLNKVYVKCFSKMDDSSVSFYKDGYTDLRGKFNYLSLNTDQIKRIQRFAIFVMHDELGSMIKECNPPKNIKKDETSGGNDYEQYQHHRQEMKNIWRSQNNKY